jgi:integrase
VLEASLAASKPELKPRTYKGYVAIYDNRILPQVGARKVGTLTRSDVQAWVGELHAAKLSPATVHHHYVALKKALRHDLDDRLISDNPCDGVRLTKGHNADGFKSVFLTAAQVKSLADLLDFQHPYGLLVRFAAYTGLRAGELTGLCIRDLNLKAGHVEVRQTLQHIAGEWVVGTPKSARSTRNVPLVSRALVADLREDLLTHPRSGDPDALVWPGRNPGSYAVTYERVFDVASFRRNYLKPALRSLKMDDGMRFHDLRHTFASLMLAAQFPPYEVSRWMGHANLATTDSIYAHLYPSDYSAHLDRFDAFATTNVRAP